MDLQRVAVAGTGMIGPGIAATFALAGRQATIVSRTPQGAAKGVATARSFIEILAANGLADPAQGRDAAAQLVPSVDLEATVRGAQLFVESLPESLPLKQEFFARLDRASPDTILCSSTSGISISAIAERSSRPERILTTHFWNPPHLMPLVEVSVGRRTDPGIAEGAGGPVAPRRLAHPVPPLADGEPLLIQRPFLGALRARPWSSTSS